MEEKYCPGCGEYKQVKEFHKDSSRGDGYQIYCITCHSKKKKRKKTLRPIISRPKPLDGGQIFEDIYSNKDIHEYLWEVANKKTKDRELRKDLVQTAWIRISFCMDTYSVEKIKNEGRRAINNEYRRVWNMRRNDLEYLETLSVDEWNMWRRGFC
jgi:hypothetical protein